MLFPLWSHHRLVVIQKVGTLIVIQVYSTLEPEVLWIRELSRRISPDRRCSRQLSLGCAQRLYRHLNSARTSRTRHRQPLSWAAKYPRRGGGARLPNFANSADYSCTLFSSKNECKQVGRGASSSSLHSKGKTEKRLANHTVVSAL